MMYIFLENPSPDYHVSSVIIQDVPINMGIHGNEFDIVFVMN